MATRNLKQKGQAWGAVTASIIATIDGQQIYAGPVNTIDNPVPFMPGGPDITNDLFAWNIDRSFHGTQFMSIKTNGAMVMLASTTSDHTNPNDITAYSTLQYQQMIDDVVVTDCLTHVTIDGVPVFRSASPPGQWCWLLQPGQTLQARVNITRGC